MGHICEMRMHARTTGSVPQAGGWRRGLAPRHGQGTVGQRPRNCRRPVVEKPELSHVSGTEDAPRLVAVQEPQLRQQQAPPPPAVQDGEQEEQQQQGWEAAEAEQQEQQKASIRQQRLQGLACLLAVTVLWASYGPAIRLALNLPGPPSPVVITVLSSLLEIVLLTAWITLSSGSGKEGPGEGPQSSNAAALTPIGSKGGLGLPLGLSAALLGGAEIGLYNAAGTLAQSTGLSMTTALRGAFLVQASTLFTPILAAMAGNAPTRAVWAGSVLALVGTLLISLDGTGGLQQLTEQGAVTAASSTDALLQAAAAASTAPGSAATTLVGDLLTVFAALCYSAATVRIPVWAVQYRVSPLTLALGKARVLAAVSLVALGLTASQLLSSGQPLEALWPGWQHPAGWGYIAWVGLGPCTLAGVLLMKGQSLVPPADAQVLFCLVPLFSALVAAVVLPGESVGWITWVGGAIIAAAGFVAVVPSIQAAARQQDRRLESQKTS